MSVLLDYVFPITVIEPIPPASTGFLKQIAAVVKPKAGQEGNVGQIFPCTSMTQVAARTDNTNAQQIFNAGHSRVILLLADDLDLEDYTEQLRGEAYTLLISDDFDDGDLTEVIVPAVKATVKIQDLTYEAKTAGAAGNAITVAYTDTNTGGAATASVVGSAITVSIEEGVTSASAIAAAIVASTPANALVAVVVDEGDEDDAQSAQTATNLAGGSNQTTEAGTLEVGTFDGVVAFSSSDIEVCETFCAPPKRCAFFRDDANGAKNMFFAFGAMLSNQASWRNQQYIAMPYNDHIESLGDANNLFDKRISFVLSTTEQGNRLAFFAAGGKAIVEPYIKKNLMIDLQSRALTWISANQPDYTVVNASLLESDLQDEVIEKKYINTKWLSAATVTITLVNDNFVASGKIEIAEPGALWKIVGELTENL